MRTSTLEAELECVTFHSLSALSIFFSVLFKLAAERFAKTHELSWLEPPTTLTQPIFDVREWWAQSQPNQQSRPSEQGNSRLKKGQWVGGGPRETKGSHSSMTMVLALLSLHLFFIRYDQNMIIIILYCLRLPNLMIHPLLA